MSRRDGTGVISRKRRGALTKRARWLAGTWLLNDLEIYGGRLQRRHAAELGRQNAAEDTLVRAAITRIAEALIKASKP